MQLQEHPDQVFQCAYDFVTDASLNLTEVENELALAAATASLAATAPEATTAATLAALTAAAPFALAASGIGILALLLVYNAANPLPITQAQIQAQGQQRPPEPPNNSNDDRNRQGCKTNARPGTGVPFDPSSPENEMKDIMCNIRKYTAPNGPNPDSWWNELNGKVNLHWLMLGTSANEVN